MNLGGSKMIEIAWWNLPFYTWVVSGALVVIALILRNTSWENKLTVVILAVFAACAYGLKDHDVVLQGLQVASYGIFVVAAIWLVHGILRSRLPRPGPHVAAASAEPVAAAPTEPPAANV